MLVLVSMLVIPSLELCLHLHHERVFLTTKVVQGSIGLQISDVELEETRQERVHANVTLAHVCDVKTSEGTGLDVGQKDLCEAPIEHRRASTVVADSGDVQDDPIWLFSSRCSRLPQADLKQFQAHDIAEIETSLDDIITAGGIHVSVPVSRVDYECVIEVLLVCGRRSWSNDYLVMIVAEDVRARGQWIVCFLKLREGSLTGVHRLSLMDKEIVDIAVQSSRRQRVFPLGRCESKGTSTERAMWRKVFPELRRTGETRCVSISLFC